MSAIPPEQPGTPAENAAPPDSTYNEPRLLTRRDAEPAVTRGEPQPKPLVSRKPRRWLRAALISSVALVALALAGVFGLRLWLQHTMQAALPQLDGTLHVGGLHAAVTVTRDAQGVPSIHAASLDDLLFAQGYITAQDRLWQMDMLRRHAAGELAEILGPALIDHDRQQRILQLRAAADRAVVGMDREQRGELEAYARGVNASIDAQGEHLPVEFHVLHYQPRPWTPRDSVLVDLVMWQSLATSFPHKLAREALSAHLPADLLSDLYPVGSWRDRPPTQPRPDLTTPKPEIEQIPLDSTQSELRRPTVAPADLLRRARSLGVSDCDACRAGSNNWVVAGSRSASGSPLVSNDMHLDLSIPDIWYEAGLHTSDEAPLDVTGFTLPGVPFVLVGRNAHVAWGFTNLLADVQDVYVEHTRGSGSSAEFQQANGGWAPVQHHREQIVVRGARDITLDVETTQHHMGSTVFETPIISSLYKGEQRSLSLVWTAYDPSALAMPLHELDTAASGQELVNACLHFGGPSLNLVYADDAGHIGYHAIGLVPVRGPAEKRPRLLPQLDIPSGPPVDNETPDGEDGAMLRVAKPRLVEAAYVPARRRRVARAKPQPAPGPQAPAEDIPAPPPAIDYTIGSPISSVPVDALDAAQQWSSYIPYDQLPAVVDPASGFLDTANSRVTADDYPYAITNEWLDPYRTERINVLLERSSGLKPEDMLRIQMDVHSDVDLFFAQRLAYAVDHASAKTLRTDAKRLHGAAEILRRWNGNMDADAAAPAIVTAFRRAVGLTLLVPQIKAHDHITNDREAQAIARLYAWGESTTALENIVNMEPARWLPAGYSNWNDLLAASLEQALHVAGAPSDLRQWRFGAMHPLEIDHPLFGQHPLAARLLGIPPGTGLRSLGGDNTTLEDIGPHFGPSERFTADLSSADATIANLATGQSGNPASPWYLDQFTPWLVGTSFSLPLAQAGTTHTLTLEP